MPSSFLDGMSSSCQCFFLFYNFQTGWKKWEPTGSNGISVSHCTSDRRVFCRENRIFHYKICRNLLKINNQDMKQDKASLVKSLSHNIIPRRVEENKKIGGVAIENNARYLHFPLTL